jgi:ferredoxin, 2Fe-2S
MLLWVTQANGALHEVNAQEGQTLLSAIQNASVDGLVAECGGNSVCATCHCYIDEAQIASIQPADDDEEQMLEFVAAERKDNSRLACQLQITSNMDGLKIQLPDRQF